VSSLLPRMQVRRVGVVVPGWCLLQRRPVARAHRVGRAATRSPRRRRQAGTAGWGCTRLVGPRRWLRMRWPLGVRLLLMLLLMLLMLLMLLLLRLLGRRWRGARGLPGGCNRRGAARGLCLVRSAGCGAGL